MPGVRSVSGCRLAVTASLLALGSVGLFGPGAACAAGKPASATTLDCGQVQSAILGNSVAYCVDLPADYASSSRRYPVLYILHGLFENERDWAERGGKDVFDGMLAKGQLQPFIVVCPDAGRTFYVNSYDGKVRYEDFFVQELIPYIDQHYRTVATPAERGLFGISMGGFGSLHIGFRHPGLFGAVSAQSAALLPKFPNPFPATGRWQHYAQLLQGPFGSPLNEAYFEANNPIDLAEHPESFRNLKLYFDCGDHDRYGFQEGNQLLDQVLTAKQFPHQFTLRAGDHGWSYEQDYMQYALQFHAQQFQQALASAPAAGAAAGGRSK
ncbi:MAG TPA: alpha/beta hydrolase family protein [Terriglobia bacterium]|jgi:S-formylglutathione hydrolase FrmB|nr:alpha/beta hydrolase family protein [Terriglobia bacterium]